MIAAALHAQAEAMGIATVRERIDGKPVEYRRVVCATCGAHEQSRHALNVLPDVVRQNFVMKGWRHSGRAWNCPSHGTLKRARGKSDGPIEKGRAMSTMTKMPTATIRDPAPGPETTGGVPPRGMTPEDKAKIREFLDLHYDERRKVLLDGHTDKTAGEKLNMPWAWIRDIREAAYGPIAGDAELIELKQELQKLIVATGLALSKFDERLKAAERRLADR